MHSTRSFILTIPCPISSWTTICQRLDSADRDIFSENASYPIFHASKLVEVRCILQIWAIIMHYQVLVYRWACSEQFFLRETLNGVVDIDAFKAITARQLPNKYEGLVYVNRYFQAGKAWKKFYIIQEKLYHFTTKTFMVLQCPSMATSLQRLIGDWPRFNTLLWCGSIRLQSGTSKRRS